MPGQIMPVTYMGGNKMHHRFTTQDIPYWCEGIGCQYCKEEEMDKSNQQAKPVEAAEQVEDAVPKQAENPTFKTEVPIDHPLKSEDE